MRVWCLSSVLIIGVKIFVIGCLMSVSCMSCVFFVVLCVLFLILMKVIIGCCGVVWRWLSGVCCIFFGFCNCSWYWRWKMKKLVWFLNFCKIFCMVSGCWLGMLMVLLLLILLKLILFIVNRCVSRWLSCIVCCWGIFGMRVVIIILIGWWC